MTNAMNKTATPGRRLRPALNTLARIRDEMGRVYRACRNGEVAMADGSRLIYMLDRMARLLVDVELEKRIEALERNNADALPISGGRCFEHMAPGQTPTIETAHIDCDLSGEKNG